MLLDRNLSVEHALSPYPVIPRFRHSHRVFCYFLKSQRENSKDAHLFYGTANTESTSLPILRGLFTCEPPAEAIPLRWMMSSWQQPHERRHAERGDASQAHQGINVQTQEWEKGKGTLQNVP